MEEYSAWLELQAISSEEVNERKGQYIDLMTFEHRTEHEEVE